MCNIIAVSLATLRERERERESYSLNNNKRGGEE